MKKVIGTPKSLKQLLQNTKYTIHYYQREYRWQEKHIREMIDDLTMEFLGNYQSGHKRTATANYGVYFMGSIVLAGEENAIIDGQQRLSSLTLLLIYLNNRLRKNGKNYSLIDAMIFSDAYGEKSFNIDVDERHDCMDAIYNDSLESFDRTNATESVKNLVDRYEDIVDLFPNEIPDAIVLNFCDWLAEKVFFVEIVAETDQDAHKIFVTMNDRGLNLTSSEMLKGYLLSEIKDDAKRKKFNDAWKDTIFALKKEDDKGDEVFIRAWLRAQYAVSIREKKAGAGNKDYDIIGGQFHKWVRDEHKKLDLNSATDFEKFIETFLYFADFYLKIRDAEKNFSEKTKYVYYNAQLDFTLQPQLLMAPICYGDDIATVTKKINLTARFIDLWINARVINYRSLGYSTIKDYIFSVSKSIRRCSVKELKIKLKKHYVDLNHNHTTAIPHFGLNQFTKKYIKNILARITSFIEEKTLVTPLYVEYMKTKIKNPFEIEHIICDHFDRFKSEFADEEEFYRYRNSIGALLLLPKSINASLNDSNYSEKIKSYYSENIYAKSLNKEAYKNNPQFLKFIKANNLSFEPFDKFGKIEINKRIQLVIELVNLIWNAEEFND